MKVLIYFPKNKLAPEGGPAGYLYNLYNELIKFSDDFEVLPSEFDISNNRSIRNRIPKRIREIRRVFRYMKIHKREKEPAVNLDKYDIVHFHFTEDMYYCRRWLQGYKGKVVLSSHSPCVYHKEFLSKVNPKDLKRFETKLKTLEKMDEYSFERADYVIFPCKEAEEPYEHTWDKYLEIRKADKYRYLPTGITGCKAKESRASIREKYGIPEDAFVVSYVGRHNEIKGYGNLKKIGKELLEDKNVYFLIAGQETPMTGIDDKRWIEVGWTNDPHSIIAASDLFVLPNKETYFDLILLEVMSLGIPVVLSKTGGNKYFERFNSDSLMEYEEIGEAVNLIKLFMKKNFDEQKSIGEKNKELFERYFTVEKFAKDYANLIASLENNHESDKE